MSVTPASDGSNSFHITYTAAETLADILPVVSIQLGLRGWTTYDIGLANVVAYRALCQDGITYKYFTLDYTTANYMLVKVWESWNSSTHTGTNLAYNSDQSAYAQRIALAAGGIIYGYAQSTYAIFWTNNSGTIGASTGNSWTGIIEISRDNPGDSASNYEVPPYVWTTGYGIFTQSSNAPSVVEFCRVRNGNIGSAASANAFVSTEMGMGGTAYSGNSFTLAGFSPPAVNGWDGSNWAFTIRCGVLYVNQQNEVRGRLMGISLLNESVGSASPNVDTINLKLLANTNFIDPAGTTTLCWILSEGTQSGRFAIPQ